jgi:hypothetical protein
LGTLLDLKARDVRLHARRTTFFPEPKADCHAEDQQDRNGAHDEAPQRRLRAEPGERSRRGARRPRAGQLPQIVGTSLIVCWRCSGFLAGISGRAASARAALPGSDDSTGRGLAVNDGVERGRGGVALERSRPVATSYRMQPNEKMSERASTGLPSTCSGDM